MRTQVQLKDQGIDRIGNAFVVKEQTPELIAEYTRVHIALDAKHRLPPGTVYEVLVNVPDPEEKDPPLYVAWLWTPDTDQDSPLGDITEGENRMPDGNTYEVIMRCRTPE